MKFKAIGAVILSFMLAIGNMSVLAADTAIYDINTEIEALKNLSTDSTNNWEVVDETARVRASGGAMRINLRNSDSYTVEALAGEDLYAVLNTDSATSFQFSVEVKADEPIQVEGMMGGKNVFSLESTGGSEYEKLSADFEILPEDYLAVGDGNAEDFKLVFKGTANSYVENLSVRKLVEKERFIGLTDFSDMTAGVESCIFATEDVETEVVLSVLSDENETVIENIACSLTQGINNIKLEGDIPQTVREDDILVIYITDGSGNILSERKQSIGKFYANGVNILSSDLKVKEALEVFGGGEYLLEFDTDLETVKATIGTVSVNSVSGICEIILSDEDIASLTEDAVIEFDSEVSNVTLRKVAD